MAGERVRVTRRRRECTTKRAGEEIEDSNPRLASHHHRRHRSRPRHRVLSRLSRLRTDPPEPVQDHVFHEDGQQSLRAHPYRRAPVAEPARSPEPRSHAVPSRLPRDPPGNSIAPSLISGPTASNASIAPSMATRPSPAAAMSTSWTRTEIPSNWRRRLKANKGEGDLRAGRGRGRGPQAKLARPVAGWRSQRVSMSL